jgi:hypothetical protein
MIGTTTSIVLSTDDDDADDDDVLAVAAAVESGTGEGAGTVDNAASATTDVSRVA